MNTVQFTPENILHPSQFTLESMPRSSQFTLEGMPRSSQWNAVPAFWSGSAPNSSVLGNSPLDRSCSCGQVQPQQLDAELPASQQMTVEPESQQGLSQPIFELYHGIRSLVAQFVSDVVQTIVQKIFGQTSEMQTGLDESPAVVGGDDMGFLDKVGGLMQSVEDAIDEGVEAVGKIGDLLDRGGKLTDTVTSTTSNAWEKATGFFSKF